MGKGILALAFLLFGHVDLHAEEPGACRIDVKKYCSDAQPGLGVVKCLKQHEKELSDSCKTKESETKEKTHGLIIDCKEDAKKYCAGLEAGSTQLKNCLKVTGKKKLALDCARALGL